MFLLAITRQPIIKRFQNLDYSINQFNSELLIHTVVTDNFLSKFIKSKAGYRVSESLFDDTTFKENILLVDINFSSQKNILSIFKTTVSGRPIYYHTNPKGEFFCSTHISMLRVAGVNIEENSKVLPEFFIYRYVISPNTLYKNIYQLGVGSKLIISIKNKNCVIKNIEEYAFTEKKRTSNNYSNSDHYADKAYLDLQAAIEILKPVKNKSTVLLSGGLDSSILFKYSQKLLDLEESYSTVYPFETEDSNLEKNYALSAAKAFHSNHSLYQSSTNEFLFGLLDTIYNTETPIHHLQSVLLHLLFKNGFKNNNQIVISGEGADGIFGNDLHTLIYSWHINKNINSIASTYILKKILKTSANLIGKGLGFIRTIEAGKDIKASLEDDSNILYRLGKYGDESWVKNYFNVSFNEIIESRYNAIKNYKEQSLYDIVSILTILGGGGETQNIWSKIGEGNKKIVYYPFYRDDLIKSTFDIPWDVKLKNPKNILRHVAKNLQIPHNIISRPKASFGIDPSKWAEKGAAFEPLKALTYKYFDKDIVENTQSSNPAKAMIFWNIINYSIWKRLHIDGETLDGLKDELTEHISNSKSG